MRVDALRAEFPGAFGAATLVRRPGVAQESALWALVSGVGAALIARATAQLVVIPAYAFVFPPTQEHPAWLTPRSLWDPIAEIAAGMVLARAGGLAAVLAYVVLELLVLAASLPGRVFACSGSSLGLDTGACDYRSLVMDRWPLWIALVMGVLAGRLLASRGDGANALLRAAGAFSLVVTVVTNLGSIWFYTHFPSMGTTAITLVFAAGQIIGGLAAGALLWRSALARPILLAILLAAPALAFGVPSLRANPQPTYLPLELLFQTWSVLLIPIAAVVALFVGRYVREILEPSPIAVV